MGEYTTINAKRDIRLLSLHSGMEGEPLTFSLNVVSLDSLPLYEAISYTWGDHHDREAVHCNGHAFSVTRNLADVLNRLRQQDAHRLLWADAVCINQEDLEERAQQVSIMRKIYEGAQRVLVWLGHADGCADLVLDLIREVANFHLQHHELEREVDDFVDATYHERFDETIQDEFLYERLESLDPKLSMSVDAFYQRPWFARVWIIQEVTRNHQVTAFCGSHSIEWHVFALGTSLLLDHCQHRMSVGQQPPFALSNLAGSRHVATILSSRTWIEHKNFTDIMKVSRTFLATDPRDKIYALLGCSSSEVIHNFKVDYKISAQEAYRNLGPYFFFEKNSLYALYSVNLQSKDLNEHPSWIPDFRREENLVNPTQWDMPQELWFHHDSQEFSIERDELIVTGTTFMAITAVSEPLVVVNDDGEENFSPMPLISANSSWIKPLKPRKRIQSLRDVVAALCLGKQMAKLTTKRLSIASHEDEYARLLLAYVANLTGKHLQPPIYAEGIYCPNDIPMSASSPSNTRAPPSPVEALSTYGLDGSFEAEDLRIFNRSLLDNCKGRRLFQTTNGRIGMGAGVPSARDDLVLIAGLQVPFILRPTGAPDRYRCVGQCFEYGVMRGDFGGRTMKELRGRRLVLI